MTRRSSANSPVLFSAIWAWNRKRADKAAVIFGKLKICRPSPGSWMLYIHCRNVSASPLATVAIFPYTSKAIQIEVYMKILAESTLTSKEQLTVPRVVRRLLDLHAGDRLVWSLDAEGRLVVSGGRTNTLEDIRAAVAAAKKTEGKPGDTSKTPARVTIEDMKSGIARAVRSKHGRR
jgi:bifunctional DNA-binding transcriptional regulator/antitoxin component of YhaV-PrlF toxin-antitoxin module